MIKPKALVRDSFKNYFNEFLALHGWMGLVRVAIYPLTSLFSNPIIICKTFLNLTVLLKGKWEHYSSMSVFRSLTYSFHRAYSCYMEKYGRYGYCYDISLGKSLASLFFFHKISMTLYKRHDILVPIGGTLGFWAAMLSWYGLEGVMPEFLFLTMILVLFSSMLYYNAVEALKYDALGWTFVPIVFWGLLSGNLLAASLALLVISFFSVSVLVPVTVMFAALSIFLNPLGIFATVPAMLKLLTHFAFLLKDFKSFQSTADGIGFSRKGAKIRKLNFGLDGLFFTSVWGAYWVLLFFFGNDAAIFPLKAQAFFLGTSIALFIINQKILRFADNQSVFMLMIFSLALVTVFQHNYFFLLLLWMGISPPPVLLAFAGEHSLTRLDRLPVRKPFFIKPAYDKMNEFLKEVKKMTVYFFHTSSYLMFIPTLTPTSR